VQSVALLLEEKGGDEVLTERQTQY